MLQTHFTPFHLFSYCSVLISVTLLAPATSYGPLSSLRCTFVAVAVVVLSFAHFSYFRFGCSHSRAAQLFERRRHSLRHRREERKRRKKKEKKMNSRLDDEHLCAVLINPIQPSTTVRANSFSVWGRITVATPLLHANRTKKTKILF